MAERALVCIPVDFDQAMRVYSGHAIEGPVQAFTANSALCQTFELNSDDQESAEYAAMLMAGLWALVHGERRLVLTAVVDSSVLTEGAESANGGVSLLEVRATSVEAWFSDEDDSVVQPLLDLVHGLSLDEAWDLPEIAALHADHDLSWHSITEQIRI